MTDVAVNGRGQLYDEGVEIALTAALVASPGQLALGESVGFAVDRLTDLRAQLVIGAVINMTRTSEAIDQVAVRAWLERQGNDGLERWWPSVFARTAEPKPDGLVQGWMATVVRFADARAAQLETESAKAREEAELDEFALRDAETMVDPRGDAVDELGPRREAKSKAQPKPRWRRGTELAALILERAKEPWVRLTLGGEEIVKVRLGGMVVVMGPTGAGKTSLVVGVLIEHARNVGPVIVLSRELPSDELGARGIGMQCDASWPDVLTGQVPLDQMQGAIGLVRLYVLDRKDATLHRLAEAIAAAKLEFPGEPVMIVADYVQILAESQLTDARMRVSEIVARLEELTRTADVVTIAISQMSRAASRAARAGDATGADSIDGGAESASIEQAASVTLCIGASGQQRENGTAAVDLSIGKGRMTGGDKVIPMSYCGRTGRWRIDGEIKSAASVKGERAAARDDARNETARNAMIGFAASAKAPVTREELAMAAGLRATSARELVKRLLEDGDLVEVRSRPTRSRFWRLWTAALALGSGIQIVDGDE